MNDLMFDKEYAKRLSNRLTRFKITKQRPFNCLFRCPVCGDSKKRKHVTRGSIYEGSTGKTKGVMLFDCYNCNNEGKGAEPFFLFLKKNFPDIYDQYRIEKFRRSRQPRKQEPVFKAKMPEPKPKDILEENPLYEKISDLDPAHPVRRYIEKRLIPKKHWDKLGFTLRWKAFCNSICPESFKEPIWKEEPRLVIPFYTKSGLVAVQGRALKKDSQIRYQTIKMDDSFSKLYGTERIDETKPVIFVEGPLDSLFLDNSVALAGGYMSVDNLPYKSNRVFALDNEPRSKDTFMRMINLIRANEKVVIWDRVPPFHNKKDINDMVLSGWDPTEYVLENAITGLNAQLRLLTWKKCMVGVNVFNKL